jgi:hypothetical protein
MYASQILDGPMRNDPISYRARTALNRLSRNRWISGKECEKIVRNWVTHAGAYKAVMSGGIEYVGILRGWPPAFTFEDHYKEVYKITQSDKSDVEIMIKLLSILLRIQDENIWRSKKRTRNMFYVG